MAEDRLGVQTRAMTEARHTEEETQRQLDNQQAQMNGDRFIIRPERMTPNMDQPDAVLNPTVELTRINGNQQGVSDENIEEYVRRHSEIGLDWYVLDLSNTCIRDLIKTRLPCKTGRGRILFNCPELRDFFPVSNFEVDLGTGQVYTYSVPPEDIGVSCQE